MKRAFWDLIRSDLEAEPQRFDHILKLIEEIRDRLCWCCPRHRERIHSGIDVDLLRQMFSHKAFDPQAFGQVCYFLMDTLELYCSPDHHKDLSAWTADQKAKLQNDIKYSEWIPQFFEGVHGHIDIIEDQIRQFQKEMQART